MWSYVASTIPVARIFGGILDGHLDGIFGRASGRYLIGRYQMRG
jgi:hypothetical protein